MRLIVFLLASALSISNLFAQSLFEHGRLEVTKDGHYLQFADGSPFFWLGDTGWELFHRLTLPEIKEYLDNRSAKGFTVIQAVVLAEFGGLRKPNQYGQLPLINSDPATPNNQYFEVIDSAIHMARQRNLFIGLLPSWGDKIIKAWGEGPVVFDSTNAYSYGKWLGNRYKNEPNIIWILGGDRPAYGIVLIRSQCGVQWQRVLLMQPAMNASLLIIHRVAIIPLHNGFTMKPGWILICFNRDMEVAMMCHAGNW